MENGQFIDVFPSYKPPFMVGIFHGYVSHNQRANVPTKPPSRFQAQQGPPSLRNSAVRLVALGSPALQGPASRHLSWLSTGKIYGKPWFLSSKIDMTVWVFGEFSLESNDFLHIWDMQNPFKTHSHPGLQLHLCCAKLFHQQPNS